MKRIFGRRIFFGDVYPGADSDRITISEALNGHEIGEACGKAFKGFEGIALGFPGLSLKFLPVGFVVIDPAEVIRPLELACGGIVETDLRHGMHLED